MNALEEYIESAIKEEDSRYTKEYRESKWYRKPSLKDCFNEHIAGEIENMRKAIAAGKSTEPFVALFEDMAREYGKSWLDEDLSMVRCGYEFETRVCTHLRNIAATLAGKETAEWQDFYEGFEYKI